MTLRREHSSDVPQTRSRSKGHARTRFAMFTCTEADTMDGNQRQLRFTGHIIRGQSRFITTPLSLEMLGLDSTNVVAI